MVTHKTASDDGGAAAKAGLALAGNLDFKKISFSSGDHADGLALDVRYVVSLFLFRNLNIS